MAIEYMLFLVLARHSNIVTYPITSLMAFVKITASCS
jgi:hypothetical protein